MSRKRIKSLSEMTEDEKTALCRYHGSQFTQEFEAFLKLFESEDNEKTNPESSDL